MIFTLMLYTALMVGPVLRRESGVAFLLEIVIGLGIFTAALLSMLGIFVMSHTTTTSTKNLAVAADLAREFMEQQLCAGFDAVTSQVPVDIPVPATVNGVATFTVFTVAVEVFVEAAGPPPKDFQRKRVLVTVSWREGTGADRSTRLETYVVD